MNVIESDSRAEEVFRDPCEPGATRYFKGLTRINGVTRAVIDSGGNSVIVNTVVFNIKNVDGKIANTTTVTSQDGKTYIYNQELGYFLPVATPVPQRASSTS